MGRSYDDDEVNFDFDLLSFQNQSRPLVFLLLRGLPSKGEDITREQPFPPVPIKFPPPKKNANGLNRPIQIVPRAMII